MIICLRAFRVLLKNNPQATLVHVVREKKGGKAEFAAATDGRGDTKFDSLLS